MATEYTETLDTILQDTLPQLPGIVRAVAERELRMAMREFFERSYAWRTTIEAVDAPAGDVAVWLQDANDGDTNSEVVSVLQVRYDADPGGQGNSRRVLAPLGGKPAYEYDNQNYPLGYRMTSNGDEFKLYPKLNVAVAGGLEIDVALTPKLDATVFPRQITTKFYDAIIEGFLARVYMHPNKPYSAPALAGVQRQNFKRRIGYYMAQAKTGYNNSQVWGYPGGWSPQRLGGNG